MKARTKPPKRKKPRKRSQAERASAVTIDQRIQAIVQIRLDGAECWDVREYVAQLETTGAPPWKVEDGCKPLSRRRIEEYTTEADKRISASSRMSSREALRRHKAQRRSLYARAVQAGDIGTALAVLKDLATLQDLYPIKKVAVKAEHTGKDGGKMEVETTVIDSRAKILSFAEEFRQAAMRNLQEEAEDEQPNEAKSI